MTLEGTGFNSEGIEPLLDPNPPQCPQCDGPGFFLGQLGTLEWWRCRNCGIDFSTIGVRGSDGEEEASREPADAG